jgi:hypothetical protein
VLLMADESTEAAAKIFMQMPECREKRRVYREMLSPSHAGPRWMELVRD